MRSRSVTRRARASSSATSSSPSSFIPALSRSTSACAPTGRSKRPPIPNACAPNSPTPVRKAMTPSRSSSCTPTVIRRMSAWSARSPANSASPRSPKAMSPRRSSSSFRVAIRPWSTLISRRSSRATYARVMFTRSAGGLTSATLFAGKDAILSGPAGGVVAMARTGISAGFKRIIGFDMGGTSTDVAHFDGEFERAFETEVAGVRMRAPMMKIHTVAAGGGSILSFDGARFRVGPGSAGADPGPAAYRRGGPLTVTDANLMTGKLIPDLFPKVFGPGGDEPLDDKIVHERFASLVRDIGDGREPEAVADGFLAIAVAKMAKAIKTISVARGYDVTRYALNCFGGAGGQHACDVADALAISTVLIHPFSSLLSAYGMGLADIAAQRAQGVDEPLRIEALVRISAIVDQLSDAAVTEVAGQGIAREAIKVHRRAQLRYSGSDTTIEVPLSTPAAMRRAFESAHKSRFGFIDRNKAIVIEAVSVEAVGGAARLAERTSVDAD